MSPLIIVGIGFLGGLGTIARFLVDGALSSKWSMSFPIGTFVVNLSGAFALGILAGATTSEDAIHLAATGLLGAYTTFSTWALESHRLGEDGELRFAAINFLASLALGVALAWLGTELGEAL